MELVIVNTGCANIASVRFAIERLGYAVQVSDDAAVIKDADKVFLPGVGSAGAAMSQIKAKGLDKILPSLTQPVLGICLGMQLQTAFSEEGDVPCLGMIPTRVNKLQVGNLRLPHMGWNQIRVTQNHALFDGIANDSYFYFVHGFAAPVSDVTLASCDYGQAFSASIGKDNFMGVQFHPERSGTNGARLLRNFIEQC